MEFILGFVIGVVLGAGIALVVGLLRARMAERQMREAFSALAADALDANSRRLTEQASSVLDSRKTLIDQTIKNVNERLEGVRKLLQSVETDRREDFGKLSSSIRSLSGTTGELHRMLASTQRRGAWGERMADDVLRLVGLQEGINYSKQSTADAESGRPDFTFFLPNDLKVNMDVKFPLESYKRYVDSETDDTRQQQLHELIATVRRHVTDVSRRGYIDPNVPTAPYVIVFIPSEQIYSLVLEAQQDLIDDALEKKVVLVSPLTLYAMLSVIRQAAESANIMRTADRVISLLADIENQWKKFTGGMEAMGKKIKDAHEEYEKLVTTRTRALDRRFEKIEELRQEQALTDRSEQAGETAD